jgi:ABC-type phosphate transport system substrate-binding protein
MRSSRIRLLSLCALAPLVAGAAPPRATPAQRTGFAVIVNAANPVTSLTREQVSRYFLRKSRSWPAGGPVEPVDLPESSPVRDAFSRAVHGRSVTAVKTYWQQQIFSARSTPPTEMRGDGDVVAHVRANPGAIGYVAAGAPLGAGVRAVAITP